MPASFRRRAGSLTTRCRSCPQESRFWSHPKVVLTPHNAADTDADAISRYVAEQIASFEAGGALRNLVDRVRGY
jgi:glyoxylate/hydroxypyruvate reductase A